MYQNNKFLQKLPRSVVRLLRNAYFFMLDIKMRLEGSSGDILPPMSLHFIGGGDFKKIGEQFVSHFINVGGLHPAEVVLDIGCGTGRMAIPLLNYMSPAGRYLGFDISKKAIDWCRRTFADRNDKFTFHYANIHNAEYNPRGNISATEYKFPCGDSEIDFAFATSVFTHMRRAEVMHYLAEIRRVLKPNGRAMLTFFILDEENRRRMRDGLTTYKFDQDMGDCYTIDKKTPERAIAYNIEDLHTMLSNSGLELRQPILYGSWSGRRSMLDTQDTIIIIKKATET
jgi:ubiquinone/menaquinone biosynthesis C-methylase UbiE